MVFLGHLFFVNQTPPFPKFIEWCAGNVSATEGFIMIRSKSKIIFPVEALDICKAIHVPDKFVHTSQEYEEENIV